MGFIHQIYSSLLNAWIAIGLRILPSTVHPMVVHFVIALFYVALLVDIIGHIVQQPDHFYDQASFWLLLLGFIAGVAAAAAGVIAEQYVRWTPVTNHLLGVHQEYAVFSAILAIAALASRLIARYPHSYRSRGWSFAHTGHGRSTGLSLLLLIAAVIMVSMTGAVGGTMVFQYGVGVHHVTFRSPFHG